MSNMESIDRQTRDTIAHDMSPIVIDGIEYSPVVGCWEARHAGPASGPHGAPLLDGTELTEDVHTLIRAWCHQLIVSDDGEELRDLGRRAESGIEIPEGWAVCDLIDLMQGDGGWAEDISVTHGVRDTRITSATIWLRGTCPRRYIEIDRHHGIAWAVWSPETVRAVLPSGLPEAVLDAIDAIYSGRL